LKQKRPAERGAVMLVGRARFELATNGLKERVKHRPTQFITRIYFICASGSLNFF